MSAKLTKAALAPPLRRALALQEFGPEHWTTKASATNLEFTDKNNRFYAGTYERKEEGKVFIFRPFAVISVDSRGKRHGKQLEQLPEA